METFWPLVPKIVHATVWSNEIKRRLRVITDVELDLGVGQSVSGQAVFNSSVSLLPLCTKSKM